MRVLLFHTETHDILNSYVDIKHHSIMSRVEYGAIRVMVMLVRSVARGVDRGGGMTPLSSAKSNILGMNL